MVKGFAIGVFLATVILASGIATPLTPAATGKSTRE